MLYIIGGVSRSGKSIIADKILKALRLPYLPLDSIVMGFTFGMPEYGIHDKLFPDDIAKRMWKFTLSMCDSLIYVGKDYAIEGEAILPEHVNVLMQKYPDKVKACFIGYSEADVTKKIADIQLYSVTANDWLINESDESIFDHIHNMIEYSKFIKATCAEFKIQYFDSSFDFLHAIDSAVEYLVK